LRTNCFAKNSRGELISRVSIFYYRLNFFFLKKKFSTVEIIFIVIGPRFVSNQRVFTPKLFCAFASNTEQFFRQRERNKPEPLAKVHVSFFWNCLFWRNDFEAALVARKKLCRLSAQSLAD
jgi:hypothetical protein